MNADAAHQLPVALRHALHDRWEFTREGERLHIQHRDRGTLYRPPRRVPPHWADLLDRLESAFGEHGASRAPALPLPWRGETDLTISAVQALHPYLKDRQPYVYRAGYLPQPVVRFTGKRDAAGRLEDGFLTSFVNVSRVEPIKTVDDHAAIFDSWIGVLSRLGLHARHLELFGNLRVWRRGPVEGITLRYRRAGLELGDIVLLWNARDPGYMAADLGTGLERLRWTISRAAWLDVVHGRLAHVVDPDVLDAVRTTVLLIGSGITPAARGPGNAVRRLLRLIPRDVAPLGLSTAVREFHGYWALTTTGMSPWPEIASRMEQRTRSMAVEPGCLAAQGARRSITQASPARR